MLTFDGPDGQSHSLTQSLAILDFLDHVFPAVPLLPTDPLLRAKCLQIAELVNSGIQPGEWLRHVSLCYPHTHFSSSSGQNLSVLRQVKTAEVVGSGETVDGRGLAKVQMEKGLASLEGLVAAALASRPLFAAGTTLPSLADVCVIPQLYNANRFGIDLSAFPSLVAVEKRCAELNAFQQARPEVQPDAPSSA